VTSRAMLSRSATSLTVSLALCLAAVEGHAQALPVPPSGVIGVEQRMLSPGFWIERAAAPDAVLLTPAQIDAANAKALASDPAVHDLSKVGATLGREQVLAWIKEAAGTPPASLVDASGKAIPAAALAAIQTNAGAGAVAASTATRYGLSVGRTQLRLVPSALKAYPSRELLDFESFQGGILFPGEPVVVAHESADGQWLLTLSAQGPAWAARKDIALGTREEVLAYAARQPFRVVTGDMVHTVFTPEAPELSELPLDMGTRLPLASLPEDQPVNGQVPYVAWTFDFPVRRADGSLAFKPALVRKVKDTSAGYLPLTRANILRQAFKFLGERYGWGHLYNARDCSGLTAEVYRSMGIFLPPNSGAQGRSPAWPHQQFSAADTHEARVKAVQQAQVGDLVVVPGHVLMIIGQVKGQPYVIQDVPYAVFRGADGTLRKTQVNGVSVTPLLPLFADAQQLYVDAMTSLVHLTARPAPVTPRGSAAR
jgi:hypothetical protein